MIVIPHGFSGNPGVNKWHLTQLFESLRNNIIKNHIPIAISVIMSFFLRTPHILLRGKIIFATDPLSLFLAILSPPPCSSIIL